MNFGKALAIGGLVGGSPWAALTGASMMGKKKAPIQTPTPLEPTGAMDDVQFLGGSTGSQTPRAFSYWGGVR